MAASRHSLSSIAALIGEPTRAAMLLALLDGRERSAGELATAAGLSAPATSLHLGKLLDAGLVAVSRQGRHRYFRLAGSEVVRALEALGAVATAAASPASAAFSRAADRSLPGMPRGTPEHRAFCAARTCFDHLAGALAIELAAHLEARRVLVAVDEHRYELAPSADAWLAAELDVSLEALPAGQAPARPPLPRLDRAPPAPGRRARRRRPRALLARPLAGDHEDARPCAFRRAARPSCCDSVFLRSSYNLSPRRTSRALCVVIVRAPDSEYGVCAHAAEHLARGRAEEGTHDA